MEKRYCCNHGRNNQNQSYFQLFTDKKEETVPPKLKEIIWSGPTNQCQNNALCFLSLILSRNSQNCVDTELTAWESYDYPTGDGGTGDHELTRQISPCGRNKAPYRIDARERISHLPYFVRNIVFHQYEQKYQIGPDPNYGLRFANYLFLIKN